MATLATTDPNLIDLYKRMDPEGRILEFNPAAEQMIGIGPAELNPQEWTTHYGCFLPDQRTPYPPLDLPLARAMRGEQVTPPRRNPASRIPHRIRQRKSRIARTSAPAPKLSSPIGRFGQHSPP